MIDFYFFDVSFNNIKKNMFIWWLRLILLRKIDDEVSKIIVFLLIRLKYKLYISRTIVC